jgi:hypothetical protein
MRFGFRCFFLFPVVLFLAACAREWTDAPPLVTTPSLQVAPEFEAIYDEFGGHRNFGDPITEAFVLEEDGPLLQYFQAMRLEYDRDPTVAEAKRIQLFPLGVWAMAGLTERRPAPELGGQPARYFPEAGHSVRGDFLRFYETNGGEWLLGSPLSAELDRDGRRVQYFRNGRLDLHPELPESQRVQIAFLGQAHFDAVMTFAYLETLRMQFVPAASVSSVDVFAYTQYPTLYSDDEQTLHVTVLTAEGRSVSGLRVNAQITYGATSEEISLRLTEGQNQVHLPIDTVGDFPGQRVDILVSVLSASGDVLGTDKVTFGTWW